jgi:hypothetical protein
VTEIFEVRLAGEDTPMFFDFGEGHLRVSSRASRTPDHVISTEPVGFALAVPYKRVPVVEPTLAWLSGLLLPA